MADIPTTEAGAAAPSPGADLGPVPKDQGSGLGGPPASAEGGTPPASEVKLEPKTAEPPAAGAKEPLAKTLTAADPPKGQEEKPATPADWPEDWRTRLAGDNKAAAKKLERMGSPQDVLKSYLALEQRLSAGEYKKALPTHYTAEELAEYKKSNGIPDDKDGYDVKIDGLVWGEHDKPLLDSWKQYAHENNLLPEEVKRGLAWYAREQEAMVDRMAQADQDNLARGSDTLRAEWGTEYKPNLNALQGLYQGAPDVDSNGNKVPMWDVVMSARTADGVRLGDLPEFLKWNAGLAKEINPFATLVPAAGNDPLKSADDRLTELNRMMGDKQGPYWRGPDSPKLQQEWRDLYDAKERAGARSR